MSLWVRCTCVLVRYTVFILFVLTNDDSSCIRSNIIENTFSSNLLSPMSLWDMLALVFCVKTVPPAISYEIYEWHEAYLRFASRPLQNVLPLAPLLQHFYPPSRGPVARGLQTARDVKSVSVWALRGRIRKELTFPRRESNPDPKDFLENWEPYILTVRQRGSYLSKDKNYRVHTVNHGFSHPLSCRQRHVAVNACCSLSRQSTVNNQY